MSPRFIVVADFHANIWSKYSKPCDDVNTRFHHQRMILEKIYHLARKYKANVVFDGDIFDARGSIDCRVTNMVFHEIVAGTNTLPGTYTYLLAGNHDQVDNSTRPANSLGIFKGYRRPHLYMDEGVCPNLRVIDKPMQDDLNNSSASDPFAILYFLPYSEDKTYLLKNLDRFCAKIKAVSTGVGAFSHTKFVLFGHLGVAGAKMGAHLVRLSGEFSLKDLHPDFFDWIILGHYHHRQFLDKSHHALYVGNTIPLRHEDDSQEKGVGYLDVSKNKYRFIPLDSPMFFTFNLEDVDKKADNIEKERKGILDLNTYNFVRVVSSDKTKLDWYSQHGVDTLYQPHHSYKSRLDIKPTSTSKQIVSMYCKKYQPKATKVSLEELNKAIHEQEENKDD